MCWTLYEVLEPESNAMPSHPQELTVCSHPMLISHQTFCRPEGNGMAYSVMKSKDPQPRLLHPVKLSII